MDIANLIKDGEFTMNNIIKSPLPAGQFFNEKTNKKCIYVHHTAGTADPYGVERWWASTPDRVGVSYVIGGKPNLTNKWKDGDIIQCFDDSLWCHHLGLTSAQCAVGNPGAKGNVELNKLSVAIEICNFGYLVKKDNDFVTYTGNIIPPSDVTVYSTPYKGYIYYHRYTDAQLSSLKELLQYLCEKWKIPTDYKGDDMFNVNVRALRGEPGVWTHTSVRADKFDCHPQPELIALLKTL